MSRMSQLLEGQLSAAGGVEAGVGQGVLDNGHRIQRVVLGTDARQELTERSARVRIAGGITRSGVGMMMMVMAAKGLGQILDAGELTAARGAGEVRSQLVELGRRRRIAVRLRCLGRGLQVRCDLLGDLLILSGVGLLKLLERAHQLGER